MSYKGPQKRREPPTLFPVFVKLDGRLCTVVGGGDVAARKVQSLLEAGARVKVVAPRLNAALSTLLGESGLAHVRRAYRRGDLEGSLLAFAATDSPETNEAVWRDAEAAGILVNTADDPSHCSFIVPSRVNRHPIAIAISTHGASPALARHLRERISEAVPAEYQDLARLLGRLRPELTAVHPSAKERGARWRRALESNALELLRDGKHREAEAVARCVLGLAPAIDRKQSEPWKAVIGTRGSALARAQAGEVAGRLRDIGVLVDIRTIRTAGDRTRGALARAGVGVFVREIEHALLRREVDVAVHSMKDLPTVMREGLVVAAVPPREDPRDALVSRTGKTLAELPLGSRVATSSPRRVAQLRAHRSDLVFIPVRGNLDTRLRKLSRGDFDALVVAYAGLLRLGLTERAAEIISPEICLPAPGQGALALQVRDTDDALREMVSKLDHPESRLAAAAERAFLARLGVGCSLPAGALGAVESDLLLLRAAMADPEGRRIIRRKAEGPASAAEAVGRRVAEEVLAAGGDRILAGETW